ncbi:class I adenylate-forming enzyme family protein [Mesorhizobium sp. 43Arga]
MARNQFADLAAETNGLNNVKKDYWKSETVYEALKEVADRQPEHVALVYNDQSETFGKLIEQIDKVAAHLLSIGIEKGQSVAVFAQNRPQFVHCYIACAKIGAVFVPLNFNLTAEEAKYIIGHSEAKVLFRDEMVADLSALDLPSGLVRPIDELANVSATPSPADVGRRDPDDDLIITYTSGSTGTPKAVVLSHTNQLNAAAAFVELWGLTPADTTAVGSPFGFLLGLSTVTTISLLAGAKVVIHRRFHPGEMLDAFVEHGVTIYNGVPTMFSMMLEFAEQQSVTYDLSFMRAMISSGSPLLDELRLRFARKFGVEIQNYFGMTECYPLFGRFSSDTKDAPKGAAGRLAPGAQVKFVDEGGNECAVGGQGELLARAASVVKRYHKNPELTAEAFSDGWFKTGDIGYRDADGYYYITGRSKDLIKRGGANVAPLEIEGVLARHPEVAGAAVVGVPDPKFAEIPVAFVVRQPKSALTEAALLSHASEFLARYKLPAQIFFEEELPLGRTGKVDKSALRKKWEEMTTSVPGV